MEPANTILGQLAAASKPFARRLLTIGENRLELLLVELQEERERLLRAIMLALGVAVLGLLAGIALTIMIVVLLWNLSPIAALLVLTGLYALAAGYLYRQLTLLRRDWRIIPATLDQLRKDRECLEKCLL